MITRTDSAVQVPDWQKELASAIREPEALLAALNLPPTLLDGARLGQGLFPIRVTQSYLARMTPGDIDDPLLRQVLPLDAEAQVVQGFDNDPVGDLAAQAAPGLLHKYRNRALLLTTAACAIHCRYCFRRNFPYSEVRAEDHKFQEALAYLRAHPEIDELILSGGDPLSLSDIRLAELLEQLAAIPHIQTLRIHSRLPLVLPSRVTAELCRMLDQTRMQVVLVLHANHAREFDPAVATALAALDESGVSLLNQSVLLQGVNDSVMALEDLSRTLFSHRVMPYYLHLLDRAQGAAHFEVTEDRAQALLQQLRGRMAGYLIPRLVRETAGAPHKLPL